MDAIEPFLVRNYLLYFLLPAWVALGALDWWAHRRAGIEQFGLYEPALHLAQLGLAGAPIMLGLFLEINSPVLLSMMLCFLVHEGISYIDVAWATRVRGIAPFEQRLHDYMAAVPFAAFSLVTVMHWESVASLLNDPVAALAQSFHLKSRPLPIETVIAVLALVLLFNITPYLEEFARALRHHRAARLAGR
jgi:hypothetical protein